MKVVGLCGPSGVGKTTVLEQLIGQLKGRGLRVSVIKHAHKRFDIDQPGKDSWRHREAGASEVLLTSDHRLALLREYDAPGRPDVHALLAELSPCDWVLIEGFKHEPMPKIEVWRAALGQVPLYPTDAHVVAVATDDPAALPAAASVPVIDMSDARALTDFLLANAARFDYKPPHHGH